MGHDVLATEVGQGVKSHNSPVETNKQRNIKNPQFINLPIIKKLFSKNNLICPIFKIKERKGRTERMSDVSFHVPVAH